eukprot:gnl/MRDRNA2_/MRDRNA2_87769_c0_seq1.p2 gnl/MRDRNA2_/MRDRNA2_87769_c0~~gnl/MRDRNA2_/MRDRNA2_87769_c0_seq1.p2  ORF type:complete len:134 (+),score=25.84 gnl/MRDRNA2_/MRDRNA2_87769_c0_seq1:78-479(+)
MKGALLVSLLLCAQAVRHESESQQLVEQILTMVPTCEELCKKMARSLPEGHALKTSDCHLSCYGEAAPDEVDPNASCFEKHCTKPGAKVCPNSQFMLCTKGFLQTQSVTSLRTKLNAVQSKITKYSKAKKLTL